jgi:hypothetical protein
MGASCLETSDYKLLTQKILDQLNEGCGCDDVWPELLSILGLEEQVPFWHKQIQRYHDCDNAPFLDDGMLMKR